MKTICWTQEQLQFLSELNLPFDPTRPMTEDQMIELQDVACDEVEIDPNVPAYIGTPTKRGLIAESVVDVLVDVLD